MIIECQACRSRFKLDESRIQGKGARIRCRKCGDFIIVMKSDIPPTPPSPPAAKGLFDLRAILEAPEPKGVGSPRDEADAAFGKIFSPEPETGPVVPREEKLPGPPEETIREEVARKPAQPPEEPARLSREEVDTAFDELLREDREPGTISQKPPESAPPRDEFDAAFKRPLFSEADRETPPASASKEPALDLGSPDALFPREPEKEEKPLLREKAGEIPAEGPPDRSIEELFGPPPPEKEGSEPAREPSTTLEIDTDSLDFLRKDGIPEKPDLRLDISERIRQAPLSPPEAEMPQAPLTPEPIPPFEEGRFPRMETIQEELAGLAEKRRLQEETRGPAPPPLTTPIPQIPPPKPPVVERPQTAARRRTRAPSRRTSTTLLVLLLIALAGGGTYLAFLDPGRSSLHSIFSAVKALWSSGKESARPYKVKNLAGDYESGGKSGKLFVVRGMITNQGPGKTSGIRVRAELLDKSHQTIAEKTVYAGNIIADLRSAEREQIETAMANRFGDKLSNVDIAPGDSVSFMVVFPEPPEEIEEYRVEALKGE
jgi:predicted Zn finger-like uncharacterized protein